MLMFMWSFGPLVNGNCPKMLLLRDLYHGSVYNMGPFSIHWKTWLSRPDSRGFDGVVSKFISSLRIVGPYPDLPKALN